MTTGKMTQKNTIESIPKNAGRFKKTFKQMEKLINYTIDIDTRDFGLTKYQFDKIL